MYGPDSPTTAPYTPNVTSDVLDIVFVKDFVLPVNLALSSGHLPILIDTTCQSSFQNLLDCPDFTRMYWFTFHSFLYDRLPGNTLVNDEEAIDKCVEEMTSAIQEATAASVPKRRPRADPRPPLPASIQDEICLKNRLRRQWQVTRDPALKPSSTASKDGGLLAQRVAERIVELHRGILGQRGLVAMEEVKEGDASSHSFATIASAGGLAHSDSEKAENLANWLENQFSW
jgi:hypothetical protein